MLKLRQERHSWTFEAGSRNRGAVLLYRGCDGHEAGIVVVKRNVYSATHDFTMQSRQHERARPEEIEKELGVLGRGNRRLSVQAFLFESSGKSSLGTVEKIEMEMA